MTVTGTISGTVTDPVGAVVPDAKVTITSERTGDIRNTTTNEVGAFSLVAVPPGVYSIKVEHAGFKAAQRTGVVLTATERLATGAIQLEVGAVAETVTVAAEGATVQTESSEHSAALTTGQIAELTARGREIVSLLRTIPGVQYQADQDSPGGTYGTTSPNIAGASNSMNMLAVDGVVSNDIGTPSVFSSVTTMDAIGEVKVLMHNYQAEYAANGGAVVEVVTKSGGKEYHGTGYWYARNNALNANDFFANRTGVKRPLYRYNTYGATLGGPIYIPGKFNTDKNLLFGFYNLEGLSSRIPGSLTNYTMPSALERTGDFSQTFDTNGKLIPITDPTAHAAFPGNRIPSTRLDSNGMALLKILPLPNFVNPAITGYNYNYQIQEVLDFPKRSQLFKIDYVPTDKDRFYVRGKTYLSQQQGYSVASGAGPVGFFAQCYCFTESGLGVGWTRTFSPTLVMEVTGGIRHNNEGWNPYKDTATPTQLYPTPDPMSTVLRSAIGFTAGQWYPQSNPDGIIPRFSFNVPSSPNVTFDDRFLKHGADTTFTLNDNVTVIRGSHTAKAGVSYYHLREYEGEQSVFSGTFSFSKDTNNPLETNWSFSNAALGVFQSYQEANARWGANERETAVEWYIQDSWKVVKRLTLDYGIRFTWYNQMWPAHKGEQSVLALGRYSSSKVPVLYQPAMGPGNVRMALNPLTNQYLPAAFIGTFVSGTGDPANGGVLSGDSSYPRGFVNQQPVLYGPRLGFAYDVFGNGKTAIRGGVAILYNYRLTKWSQTTKNPPAVLTPITYYGTISTLLQSAGTFAPSNTVAYNVDNKTPNTYNITFGVQQDLGHSTILDASYVGVLGRHLQLSPALNTVPYGARFLARNQDPTSPGKPLPDNFFRPYPGYNNVTFYNDAYSSNYNALLVSLSRRFARRLQIGVAYTYSKFMDYGTPPIYRPLRTWAYGVDGADQTHNMVVNFTYELPKASGLLPSPVTRYALDNWIVSGIAQFVTGTPATVGFSTTDGTDMTGGGDGQRINVIGNANSTGHTFYHWFNTAAFARPGMSDAGNGGRYNVRNPGVNNWDLAVTKRFPIKSEKRFFQLRWEAYNAFNHTQYSGLNVTARFDPAGNQTNTLFGQVTSTRAPRVMQGSLRFTF